MRFINPKNARICGIIFRRTVGAVFVAQFFEEHGRCARAAAPEAFLLRELGGVGITEDLSWPTTATAAKLSLTCRYRFRRKWGVSFGWSERWLASGDLNLHYDLPKMLARFLVAERVGKRFQRKLPIDYRLDSQRFDRGYHVELRSPRSYGDPGHSQLLAHENGGWHRASPSRQNTDLRNVSATARGCN